jgi:hypothetical protein
MFQSPHQLQEAYQKTEGKGREPERVVSLEKSSPYFIGVLCW